MIISIFMHDFLPFDHTQKMVVIIDERNFYFFWSK